MASSLIFSHDVLEAYCNINTDDLPSIWKRWWCCQDGKRSRWVRRKRNRAESVFAALKRAPRCALERTADQTFRFGKSKHFNLPSTCAIVGDFLFALSCNIAWLSLRVSALWLLRNYFTARPHRVKHDFGLYVPRQFCKVYELLWLY